MKLIILLIALVFISGCEIYKTNYMINTNDKLKLECETAALDYNYWWEAPECERYTQFHKEYEQWLVEK